MDNERPVGRPALPRTPLSKATVTMRAALGKGSELYKAGFRSVALLALAGSVAANAPRLLDAGAFDLSRALAGDGFPLAPAMLARVAVAQFVALFFQLAVIARLHAVASDRQLAYGATLAVAARRFPALLLALAAVFVVIATGVFLAAVLGHGLVFGLVTVLPLPPPAYSEPLLLAAGTAATLLFALPLATPLVYWYFAFFLVVTETRGGLAALRRSFALVRGRLWRMKVALSIVYFVFFAALLLAEALGAAAAALARAVHLPGDLAGFAVVVFGGAVAGPVPIAASLALLYDLTYDLTRRDGA